MRLREVVHLRDVLGFLWMVIFWWALCWLFSFAIGAFAAAAMFTFAFLFYFGGVARGFPSPLWNEPGTDPSRKWRRGALFAVVFFLVGAYAQAVTSSCRPECAEGALAGFGGMTYGVASKIGQTLVPGSGGLHEELDWGLEIAYLYLLGVLMSIAVDDAVSVARYLRHLSI